MEEWVRACAWIGRCGVALAAVLFSVAVVAQQPASAPASGTPNAESQRFLEMLQRKPPPMPHEAATASWPQPDYFQSALALTSSTPQERVRSPKLRLAPGAPRPPHVVLPVQTQAFGFGPVFRALLGAELDASLLRHGIPATAQTDLVDVHGPFVRRLDPQTLASLVPAGSSGIVLYAGHDGVDTAFLTLSVQRATSSTTAHRTLAMPADARTALAAMGEQLAGMLVEVGLPVRRRTPGEDAGCEPIAWQLDEPPAAASARQLACQALIVGTLLPDHDASGIGMAPQSSPARLAWLARAHALAGLDGGNGPVSRALRDLSWRQLGIDPGIALGAAAQPDDPVLARVSRLLRAPMQSRSPSRSTREAVLREVNAINVDLPALVQVAVRARALYDDGFAPLDACGFERVTPGVMVRPGCLDPDRPRPASTARPASRLELLVFQEWRLGLHVRDLRRLLQTQGRPDEAQRQLAAMPADVAAHPWLRRLAVDLASVDVMQGSFEAALQRGRATADLVLASTVDMQRQDDWARRHVLSEPGALRNLAIANDAQVRARANDDYRLVSVLRFDRYEPGPQAERRIPGEAAFFLEPNADQVRYAHMSLLTQRRAPVASPAPLQAPVLTAAAAPVTRPLFKRETVDPLEAQSLAENEARLRVDPGYITARLNVALGRLKQGGPVQEAVKLLRAHPDSQRTDNRVGESHRWGAAAGAMYYIGELPAAREFYGRTAAFGTGSESEMQAAVRIALIDGKWPQATEAAQALSTRYRSDKAARDLAGLLFLQDRPQEAWSLLEPRLAAARQPAIWTAVAVGHRLEGLEAAAASAWLESKDLGRAAVDFSEVSRFYPHLMAVLDRRPTENDVELLGRRGPQGDSAERRWIASALLMRAALGGIDKGEAHRRVLAALKDDDNFERQRFMLPAYVWTAWAATKGQDEVLARVRSGGLDGDFEGVLGKAILLALEGDRAGALRHFVAARISFAETGRGGTNMERRPVPVLYQWALAGYLLHQHTGTADFRRETLKTLRAYQRISPYVSWVYAIEAAMEPSPRLRFDAACRASRLDRGSYFLRLANVPGLGAQSCRTALSRAGTG